MSLTAWIRSVSGKFLRRATDADEIGEELRSHIACRADDLERGGLSRAEAERRARIEFGGYEKFRQESHEALGGNFAEILLQDVRVSLRGLGKAPGFTAVAVVTLALAIGANALVFAVLNGLILRPLPVPQAQSLYGIERATDNDATQSYPEYRDLRERNRSFEDLIAYTIPQVGLDTGSGASPVWGMETTGNYFDALHVQPYLGRFFHDVDDHGPNSAPYIVLSYAYWRSQFHADRNVVGHEVMVNKHAFTILGVAPDGFRGTLVFYSPSFFVPLANQQQIEGTSQVNDRRSRGLMMVTGHLKPGVTRAAAVQDLNAVGAWMEKNYPQDERQLSYSLARPGLLGDEFGRPIEAFLAGLLLLAGLILLAACANLGSLFGARAADRSREVALRLALGSSRRRILRGLLTEAMLIALAGGAAGLWASAALLRWLSDWQPFGNFPVHTPITPDASVCGIALALTLLSGLLFAAIPVRQVLRANPYEVVKSGSSGRAGGRMTGRDAMLTVQIAICAVLVTSSLVAVRGLERSLHGRFGFDTEHSMLVETDMAMAGYSGDRVAPMQERMIDAVKGIRGVTSVGLTDALLLNDANGSNVYSDRTTDLRAANAALNAYAYHVSPEYLQAEGTTLLAGRALTLHDGGGAPRVAIVNEEFARRVFGSVPGAIGGFYKLPDGSRVQVVGVVEDGKYSSLTEDAHAAMFLPVLQWPSNSAWMVVRSNRDPQQVGAALRSTLKGLDPRMPIILESRIDEMGGVLFGPRMATLALGVLGGMGALLSITGIFGMAAYSVSKRKRELGIRIALGAQRTEVLQAALGRAVKLLAWGSVAGLGLGVLASRVLASVVFLATPRDPLVLTGVVLAMALVGLAATWVPAQRALGVDPMILLREE